ncbi:hypothetical protein HDV03_005378 [Kappamyces sp. JEL0829]|nr:hypothetical protein HDV03_005378 [Kappamyces sp. JEL0829]
MPYKVIPASIVSQRTRNPIRQIVDNLKVHPNPDKEFISLALGDPTTFGNLKIDQTCVEAVAAALHSYKANGYGPSIGLVAAREAIASHYNHADAPLTAKDVFITSGCSDAINIAIGALCNEGQNILLPMPGFSLYETLASSKGIECKFYRLLPEMQWEIDLAHLESLVDENTAAILVNNPSNPCGSNYSREHLESILKVAEKHGIPVISDEIYADMVFHDQVFYPMATVSNKVPILTCGGLAKRYLVPGWRVGWIFVHDPLNVMAQIRAGIVNLSQLIIGANSLVQAAIPQILATPAAFHQNTMRILEDNALLSIKLLSGIPGITVVAPQGAMYLMLQINIEEFKGIADDLDFVEKLAQEEAVLCLPGKCFRCPSPYVRIVFSSPIEKLDEAYQRIRSFCARHHV